MTQITGKDPGKGHFYVSMAKSTLRLIGATFLLLGSDIKVIMVFGAFFIIAEVLGLLEEIV